MEAAETEGTIEAPEAVKASQPRAPQLRQGSWEATSVSIDALRAANEAGSHELDELLEQAFGVDGLGIICVTGGEDFQARVRQIRQELLPLALALERLPDVEKDKIAERGTVNVNNYSSGIDGNRSGIYFHPSTDTPLECLPAGVDLDPSFYTPNLWPDEALPELRQRARGAVPLVVAVCQDLARAVDKHCQAACEGYVQGTLLGLMHELEDCNHKCRLICYNPYEDEASRTRHKGMWAPPHKDTCLLTGLVPAVYLDSQGDRLPACPNPEVGLYIRDRRGNIAQVTAPLDAGECLFFQVGEAMQIVSGGLYQSTEHCVRGPPTAKTEYTRATLAVFHQPHAHEELPFPVGCAPQDVAKRTSDGLFRMFLHYQPADATGINFSTFCLRDGF